MGITINGQNDTISASDGSLTINGSTTILTSTGTAESPSISPSSDSNTGVFFPSADTFAISTGGTGRLFVNASGVLSVGTSAGVTGSTALAGRFATSTGTGAVINVQKSNDGTNAANIHLLKSRGTVASPTVALSGDTVGSVTAFVYSGSTFDGCASVDFTADGTVASGDAPGRITFSTRPAGYGGANTERLRITSDGKFGIGTNSPQRQLHVQGVANKDYTNNPGLLSLTDTDSFAAGVGGGIHLGGAYTSGGAVSDFAFLSGIKENATDGNYAGALVLGTRPNGSGGGSMERARIDSSGNVGLNTATPRSDVGKTFHVYNASSASTVADNANITIQSVNRNAILEFNGSATSICGTLFSTTLGTGIAGVLCDSANQALFFRTGGIAERARLDGSGRLLVGTSTARTNFFNTTSSAAFQVEGAGADDRRIAVIASSADGAAAIINLAKQRSGTVGGNTIVNDGDTLGLVSFQGSDGTEFVNAAQIYTQVDGTPAANDMPGRLVFSTTADGASSPTERMRITSNGFILAGDASEVIQYGALQVTRAADQPDDKFHIAFVRAGNKVAGMGFLDNSNTFAIQNENNTGGTGVTLTNAASSWGTTSDERLKVITGNIENGLQLIADWRTVQFKYLSDSEEQQQRIGLIAQDVQATVPQAVSMEEDELGTLQLRYTELIPVLVKALQESKERIETLEAKVAALEGV